MSENRQYYLRGDQKMYRDNKQGAPGTSKMQKPTMLLGRFAAIACMLVLAGFLLVSCDTNSNTQPQTQPDNNKPSDSKQTGATDPSPSTTENRQLKEAIASRVEGDVQYVTSSLTKTEYDPILVLEGIPVIWTLKASEDELTACNNSIIIPEYGIRLDLVAGDNLIEFTPDKAGVYFFTCWMEMIFSFISVADENGDVPEFDWSLLPEDKIETCCDD